MFKYYWSCTFMSDCDVEPFTVFRISQSYFVPIPSLSAVNVINFGGLIRLKDDKYVFLIWNYENFEKNNYLRT